jgi:carboxyl-terminal processing protease
MQKTSTGRRRRGLEAPSRETTSVAARRQSGLDALAATGRAGTTMTLALRPHPNLARAAAALLMSLLLHGCDSAGAGAAAGNGDPIDIGLLQEVARKVEHDYVAPVSGDQLTEDALKGMLTRLDPHSDYMDRDQYQQMNAVTRGRFGGIGIELTLEGRVPEVIAPIEGTPAAAAGIEPGDRILKIDGLATTGMDVEAIVKRLRGPAGSRVTLNIARSERPPFDVALTRAVIHVVSVKSALEPGRIGYARITTFSEDTASELADAIAKLKDAAHGRMNGFVLDLRNNPGGLLDAAVDVTGELIEGGTVVTTRGRGGEDDHVYRAPVAGDLIAGTPMVVLINAASASAAEIVAGALQDHHRATVIGTRSFGKGSVQTIIPIEGHGALRLTTALYYTPSGRSIQGNGITPDIVVGLPRNQQVANALVTYEDDLYGALKNTGSLSRREPTPGVAANRSSPEPFDHPIKPLDMGTRNDAQFQAALDYLQRAVRRDNGTHPG